MTLAFTLMLTSVCALTSQQESMHALLLFARSVACGILSQDTSCYHWSVHLLLARSITVTRFWSEFPESHTPVTVRHECRIAATRLVFSAKRSDHITLLLCKHARQKRLNCHAFQDPAKREAFQVSLADTLSHVVNQSTHTDIQPKASPMNGRALHRPC